MIVFNQPNIVTNNKLSIGSWKEQHNEKVAGNDLIYDMQMRNGHPKK